MCMSHSVPEKTTRREMVRIILLWGVAIAIVAIIVAISP